MLCPGHRDHRQGAWVADTGGLSIVFSSGNNGGDDLFVIRVLIFSIAVPRLNILADIFWYRAGRHDYLIQADAAWLRGLILASRHANR